MSRSQLPLNALRAFEAAARHASFTHAAEELHVTQAAVSHQVKALEERLGVALFVRRPRGLEITGEGQALLPDLRDAFDRMTNALERVGRKGQLGHPQCQPGHDLRAGLAGAAPASLPGQASRDRGAHDDGAAPRRLRARGFRLRDSLSRCSLIPSCMRLACSATC
jgi:DNA-binding transcriptional LysR family regulator